MENIGFGLSFLAGVLSTLFVGFLTSGIKILVNSQYKVQLLFTAFLLRNKYIRFSMAYLFKIKIENKYLLVKGGRINQYQPIGGVYKTFESAKNILNKYEVLDDEKIKIDNINKNDLRIRVKGKYAIKIIKWFKTFNNREVTVHREFFEELIEPIEGGADSLASFNPEYLRTVITDLRKSTYFDCNEILIYDIFDISLGDKIIKKLTGYMKNDTEKFVLCSYEDIEKEHILLNNLSHKIGEHAKYIL